MTVACESCGTPLTDSPKFCPECGAKVVGSSRRPAGEARKLVTLLFADVTGSTALGERLDPETVRTLMGRYFAVMKRVIESHGGTVEKFAGDAVMAVFGIPILHEDDAIRAVRAADEVARELANLTAETAADRGVSIQFRTGINTGEVVAGDDAVGQTLVTGDAVNTAARLEQAAAPGEVLLGRLTWQLVRDAVDAERIEPVALKGKAQPVEAYRLRSVRPGVAGHVRRLDTPLVGRERELTRLLQAYGGAVEDRACHLFTLLGSAGVGKSRLSAEFTAAVAGDARILRGRCLPYGDGTTYWPIGEIVRAASGITDDDAAEGARAKVAAQLTGEADGDRIAMAVDAAIGLSTEAAQQEDLFWAIRRFLERVAAERPLVVVIEDIHWAEPTLLDLIEHIADWSRDAPILLLCPARPELLDSRTGWGGGKLNATTLLLEPLAAEATARLIDELPGGGALPQAVEDRIAAAAEGNPLYVEEMLAVLRDEGLLVKAGDGTWQATAGLPDVRVPPSIAVLLAARLERLVANERTVAELASVVGRVFEAGAVSALAPEELRPEVSSSLRGLVRKDLVRPERSDRSPGDAYKFRHILIRDAAYERLPKAQRASLHERFADWLERTLGERVSEYEEILGYHLGSAHGYLTELGERGSPVERLAARARERFAAVGRRARERGEADVSARLLTAAAGLASLDSLEGREIYLDRAFALADAGQFDEAVNSTRAVVEASRTAGDIRSEVRARIHLVSCAVMAGRIAPDDPEHMAVLEALRPMAEAAGDERTHVEFLILEQWVLWDAGRVEESTDVGRRAAAVAERMGMRRVVEELQLDVGLDLHGPTPVDAVLAHLEGLLGSTSSGSTRALALVMTGVALAMKGDFDGARRRVGESRRIFLDLGQVFQLANTGQERAWIERLAGDHEAELKRLQEWRSLLQEAGADESGGLPAARRSHALAKLGRIDEAMTELENAESDSFPIVRVLRHLVRARFFVARGLSAEALGEADRAEDAAREVGRFLNGRTETLIDIAWIATRAGDRARARRAAEEALGLAEAKGNLALARLARSRLAEAAG
jgi:class 3 adenylate cyclase/tetratricopeptide (TPR) repeat protein